MIVQTRFSWAAALHRYAWGRRARRFYLGLLLLLVVFSGCVRVRSFLLTRRIQAVLSGLAQIRVDQTTEGQLLKTVPYLVRSGRDIHEGSSVQRYYYVEISNYEDRRWMHWVPKFLYSLRPPHQEIPTQDKWAVLSLPLKVAYALGWRHLSFAASVRVQDGTVSSTSYGIEPDVFLGWPASYFVAARSVHGFWRGRGHNLPAPVDSTDDQSPEYRFGSVAGQFSVLAGADSSIGVAYTSDAPRELISHAFQVDLRCFWNIRGCDSVRQVAPLLWTDRQAIVAATAARLFSKDPCPDRILVGRVRYLPDLNVALVEVVSSRSEEVNHEGDISREIVTDYRLKEAVRGHPQGPWTGIRYREGIPWPLSPTGEIANPVGPSVPKPGDRFLYFSGARFDSCRIVPATPSAESAVRTSVPAPRRLEDDIDGMWGRM
jgi:hypothetical protein